MTTTASQRVYAFKTKMRCENPLCGRVGPQRGKDGPRVTSSPKGRVRYWRCDACGTTWSEVGERLQSEGKEGKA